MANFDNASVFAGAGECAAKLLDQAALSDGAKVEPNIFMAAKTTKTPSRFLSIEREVNEFVLLGACEPASMTLGDAISVLMEDVCAKLKPDWVKFPSIGMQLIAHLLASRTREAQR